MDGRDQLAADHPGWNIWLSHTSTRTYWYATRRNANGLEKQDATLWADNIEGLAAQLAKGTRPDQTLRDSRLPTVEDRPPL